MPADFLYLVDNYLADLTSGISDLWDGGQALVAGSSWLNLHDYVTAAGFYTQAGVLIKSGALKMYTNRPWPSSTSWRKDMLYWINDNIGGSGGGTMADILSAMMSASYEELTQFMGITQAYKVAVWDAPFNEEYFAALARGFKTWGTG